MKFTGILFKQHIGYHLKKHWIVQGRKVVKNSPAFKILSEKGVTIYEPEDILQEKRTIEKVEVIGVAPPQIKHDKTHPDWHERICHTYQDKNVLLEGLNQAKHLTKTVTIQEGLPEKYKLDQFNKVINRSFKKSILYSHILDAQQVKLPKIKDPQRPAFNFPRVYGVELNRVNLLLFSKIVQLVESITGAEVANQRNIFNDLYFMFPFEKEEKLVQFLLGCETLINSTKPLEKITDVTTDGVELPDLYPIEDTISLIEENVYKFDNIYPINKNVRYYHPHTAFFCYNPQQVTNLFGEEVTEDQIHGMSLMKTFTIAATYARTLYGNDVKVLPKPVTLQCIHTDGRLFHFGVLQLNTLEIEEKEGLKNIWYQKERIPLFEKCAYVEGTPILENYNPDILKHIVAFYKNI